MFKLALIFAVLLSIAPIISAQQQIYKWRDEKGQLHFSNAPAIGASRPKLIPKDLQGLADVWDVKEHK